jgi:cytoskeletal protein RodZ
MSAPETPPNAGGDDPGRGLSGVQRTGVILGGLAVLLIVFLVLRGGGDDGGSSSSNAQTTATQSTGTGTATATGPSGSTATGETGSTATSTATTTSTSTSTPAEPAVRTITVVNGQPEGGIKTISYDKGDQVRLKVSSDVADEIHVHGYDLMKDVEKGGSVQFSFAASIEGRFEIELENAGTQIANLEVDPA